MRIAPHQPSAGKTLPLPNRASVKTYTARKAPAPGLSAYRAATKSIPGLTDVKRKPHEGDEQDHESECSQEEEEDSDYEEEDDDGEEEDKGEAEIAASHANEIEQASETSFDSDSNSSDGESGFGVQSRSKKVTQAVENGIDSSKKASGVVLRAGIGHQGEQKESSETHHDRSLNKELFGEDENDPETFEEQTVAVASRKRKSVEEMDDDQEAPNLLQTPLQPPRKESTVSTCGKATQPTDGHLAKKRSVGKGKSQVKRTTQYLEQDLKNWALPVDSNTKFVNGSPYRPVPKNEQMVARYQDATIDKLHYGQVAEWLKMHGIAIAKKGHAELLQLVQTVIDEHTKVLPGDLLPAGYTSVKDINGSLQPALKPESLGVLGHGSARPADRSNSVAPPVEAQSSETSFTQQLSDNLSQHRQPAPSNTTIASGQSASAGQLVSIQITPAAPADDYAHRTNEVAGTAWFKHRDVPPLPYVPGQSADVDMKVHRVRYGYAQDDVWSSPKYQDITMRDIVEAIPPDELHDFDLSQLRGYLRSTGNADVKDTSTKDQCMMMILLDVRIHRGLVILGSEHRAQRQRQQAALERQKYPEQNGVIDLTGRDDED